MLPALLWGKRAVGMSRRKSAVKTVLTQTWQSGGDSLCLSPKGNLTNSPSKAPMSLPDQGIDPLQVFPMDMELHREREEVAKVSVMGTSLHMKGIPAPSCLQGGLCSLFLPQSNPLLSCWTSTWLQHGQQHGISCASPLAPDPSKHPPSHRGQLTSTEWHQLREDPTFSLLY